MMRRRFRCNMDELPNIARFVHEFALAAGAGDRIARRLELAVDEAATNVLEHGQPGPQGLFEVMVSHSPDRISIELLDNGTPFDPTLLDPAAPKAPLNERSTRGLGLVLLREMCDELKYHRGEDGTNHLQITTYFSPSPPPKRSNKPSPSQVSP